MIVVVVVRRDKLTTAAEVKTPFSERIVFQRIRTAQAPKTGAAKMKWFDSGDGARSSASSTLELYTNLRPVHNLVEIVGWRARFGP